MNSNDKEINVINEQLLATFLFICTLIISILLNYDKKEKLKGNKGLFSSNTSKNIAIINRIAVIIIVIFYIYIDKENIDITKEKKQNLKFAYLQLFVEAITIIAALIALYITIKSNNQIIDIENPNV